ncbi:MAG: hypothetical protein AB7S26_11065 [Sandaracinaceae bacterium]
MRWLSLGVLLLGACGGSDERPQGTDDTDTTVVADDPDEGAPVDPEPTATNDDPARCDADADCEMFQPCCACPPDPLPLTHAQVAVETDRCARVRCAACGTPSQRPPAIARCVDNACVAIPDPSQSAAGS